MRGFLTAFWCCALTAGAAVPASAGSFGHDRLSHHERSIRNSDELAAKSRPRVTIYPRTIYPGPNAKRHCQSWLAQEYRVSGTVIVPRMRCWWE
jgi:hypothetical protein